MGIPIPWQQLILIEHNDKFSGAVPVSFICLFSSRVLRWHGASIRLGGLLHPKEMCLNGALNQQIALWSCSYYQL